MRLFALLDEGLCVWLLPKGMALLLALGRLDWHGQGCILLREFVTHRHLQKLSIIVQSVSVWCNGTA